MSEETTEPSSVVAEAAALLVEALSNVDGMRVYTNPGADVQPPGIVLGAPTLTWGTYSRTYSPSGATWPVFLVCKADAKTLPLMWSLLPKITAALDGLEPVAVASATPTLYPVSGAELPAYELTVEVGL
ncbi:hypothetical protein [Labedaea rhizosphaerae]|uniref:Uncharacterized protein n=1 Tax=Labedaea rhizosphaerae TaxID=598644 RepID=A0A4R6SCL7_LABRH|nr:hypothetical protein [Labedaea rhizosphaerae]TDP97650.1 hypothetical protein EV186_103614 [Labedaea rhizosphaerae]